MKRTTVLSTLIAAAVAVLPQFAFAENGVTAGEIVFGQAAALDGPAKALGTGMRAGILAAFEEANAAGGVNGRKLKLNSVDDGYEPEKSIAAVNKLIDEDKVFALIGAVGTPTSKATQPITTEKGVPFIGPFTGAGFLRDAANRNVINIRASYDEETETWIKHLTEDLKYDKIAILYQDDAYGRAGLSGVQKAMDKRSLKLVAEGTYERNTTAVKTALVAIKKAEPQAVVIVGAYGAVAEFIQLSNKLKFTPTFVNLSFVGANALANALGAEGAGVVITQVVPFPWDDSSPLIKKYTAALKAAAPDSEPGFVSLEGYIVGRLTVAALAKEGAEVTRAGFLDTVYNTGTFDLDGLKLVFGPGDNQGMGEVFITIIGPDGKFKPVDKLGG